MTALHRLHHPSRHEEGRARRRGALLITMLFTLGIPLVLLLRRGQAAGGHAGPAVEQEDAERSRQRTLRQFLP